MIYDANGNEYRALRRIGFRREPSTVEPSDVTLSAPPANGSLPEWTSYERSDDPVAARRKHG